MKKHIFSTFLISFINILIHAQTMQPGFHLRQLNTEDGLPSNNVHEVVQDADGYIWMSSTNGLCRFDGYQFEQINDFAAVGTPGSLHVARMYYDDPNRLLWVCTSFYEVECWDIRQGRFVDYTGRADTKKEYSKMRTGHRALWLFNKEGTVRRVVCNEGQFTTTDYTLGTNINQITEDSIGKAWIATDKGMMIIDEEGKRSNLCTNMPFSDVVAYEGGTVCIAADGSVVFFNRKGQREGTCSRPASLGAMGKLLSAIMSDGSLFIFTDSDTYELNLKTKQYSCPNDCQVPGGQLQQAAGDYKLVANKSGSVWLLGPKGRPRRLDLYSRYHLNDRKNRLFTLAQDSHGMLYIATYGNGLFIYDPVMQRITAHYLRSDNSPVITSDYLQQVYVDRMDNVWICSMDQGVSCVTFSKDISYKLIGFENNSDEWASSVNRLNLSDGKLLATMRDGRLLSISMADYGYDTEMPEKYYGNVSCILDDQRGRRWTGTFGQGLYVDGQHFCTDNPDNIFPSDRITKMVEDKMGRVWIATLSDGLIVGETDANGKLSFRQLLARERNEMSQQDICIDLVTGWIYVATNNGLYRADTRKNNITDVDFRNFNAQGGWLSANDLRCIACDWKGQLWIGTTNRGVSVYTSDDEGNLNEEQRLDKGNGLGGNTVKSIIVKGHYIWVATTQWLTRIDLNTDAKSHYEFGNSRNPVVFSENCALQLADGRLAFGTNTGLLIIGKNKDTERQWGIRPFIPVSITGISVNGQPVGRHDDKERLIDGIKRGEITLSHTDNTLRFNFSNFNYANIGASQYQYRLEGYDTGWMPTTSQSQATYANLQPGNYTFIVRTLQPGGQWQEAQPLKVVIMQPWWNRWWAWGIYLAVAGFVALIIGRQQRRNFILRQQMKMEKQMTDFRMNFFTNVAHEFRTPLAIIKGAVDNISNTASPNNAKTSLQTARRNTGRMMRLVNQLLNFRRLSTGTLRLHVAEDDVVGFVRNIYQDLWNMANQKGVHMQMITSERQHSMFFDHDKMETMVYNLLSNAVKYTPHGGKIMVSLRTGNSSDERTEPGKIFEFSVQDSGPGLSDDAQAHLFQPFMNGLASRGGMGIGLYSAREMARLHHGDIVYQQAEGGGACFTLTIPDDDNIYNPDEISDVKEQARQDEDDSQNAEAIIRDLLPQALNEGVRVFIIEDDADMMEQIKSEMGKYFNVKGFMNGRQGFEAVMREKPQLLVCDVMLPDMDGYEIVRQLKSHDDMRYMPTIMLTSMSDEKHQLKAYEAGADDFVVKPCNWRLLVARAMQLIRWALTNRENREKLEDVPTEDSAATAQRTKNQGNTIFESHAEKSFKERVDELIAERMSDQKLNVDTLAEMMQMGHTTFYGRMRKVTGITPNKYIMSERMKYASELLKEGQLNVGEVAWRVGFQDQSYFNKCFKAAFGVPPGKYGK